MFAILPHVLFAKVTRTEVPSAPTGQSPLCSRIVLRNFKWHAVHAETGTLDHTDHGGRRVDPSTVLRFGHLATSTAAVENRSH
jgi:hypothetical protein